MKFNMVKANEFCDSVRDGTHDSPKRVNKGYKLITSKHIKEYGLDLENAYYISEKDFNKINERSLVEKNDILYSMIGTVGLIHRIDYEPNYAIKNIGLFKLNDEIKSKWLYYYLKSPKMKSYINSLLSGSTQQYITLNKLRNLPIEIPENYIDMIKIINILELLEKKININTHTNNNLYELANKLYKKMFSMNKSTKWKKYNLTDIANINTGYSYKSSELVEYSTTGMATIKNFERKGGFKIDGFKSLNPNKEKESQYVNKFDVLVACTDLTQNADIIGNAVLLLSKGDYENIVISMDLVKVVSKINYIDNFMIYAILNSKEFKNYALGYTSGTTVLHLNKNCFKEFTIKLPEKNIIENFTKAIKPIYLKISQVMEENRRLEKLKDTLLPKLMNGEIDLDKIEI